MSQQTDDELHIDIVQRVSQQSKAVRLKVGALLVNDGVMVVGYNGTPKGWDNCCEDKVIGEDGQPELKTKPEVIHAEMNVFKKVANNPNVIKGGTLYVTHAPCTECAKLFLTMGLKRVVYLNKYRSDAGLELLRKDKIEVEYHSSRKHKYDVKITDFDKLLSVLPTEEVSIGDNVVVEPPKTALDNLNSFIERLPVESHIPLGEGVVGFSAVEERLSVLPEEEVPAIISSLSFASNEEVPLTDVSVSGMSDTDRHLMSLLLKESQGSA